MYIIFIIFIVSIIFGFAFFLYHIFEYDKHITELSERYSFEEIEKIINNDSKILAKSNFKGEILKVINKHKELWEKVKKHKHKMESDNYEDIIS